MADRILCVCLGNICRSPLAEGLLRKSAEAAGISIAVDSAGTTGFHLGDPPDGRAIVAARGHDVDISQQRARKLRRDDFDNFDLIIVMDEQVQAEVLDRRPEGVTTPVKLLTEFRDGPGPTDVPDPYYSSQFEPVIAMINEAIPGILAQVKD